jgi:lipopolysaccharide biosynthesis glycosyltransferase
MMVSMTDADWIAHLENVKLYHFLGTKPWKRRAGSHMNRLWWKLKAKVDEYLENPH